MFIIATFPRKGGRSKSAIVQEGGGGECFLFGTASRVPWAGVWL